MQTQANSPMTALEAAGERHLRALLFVLHLLAFAAIGAAALYVQFFWPRGHDVYSDLQQGASLTYLCVWMGVALVGAVATRWRKTRAVSIAVSVLILLECLSQLYFYSANHRFYHPWARSILDRFEPHPILLGIPHPGAFGGLSHDDMHRRTTINEGKAADARLIYLFGGSSTYDIGNIDSQTWASDLSRLLGPHYEVQNYGVPQYTSLESMLQSLFVFRGDKPACAVYYEGWNDLLHAHVANLADDYSPDQANRVVSTLALEYRPGRIASNWLTLQLFARALQAGPGYGRSHGGTMSDQDDLRLRQIFSENVSLTIDIDRHFGVKPILIPQILNYDFLENHYAGWWPYIPAKAVRPLMHDLNLELKHTADGSGAAFIDTPLAVDWQGGDFIDQGHFTTQGSAKFAGAIAAGVAANCR
jgi:hypothetical protein